MAQRLPIVLSHHVAELEEGFWIGGGHINLKYDNCPLDSPSHSTESEFNSNSNSALACLGAG